MLDSTCLPTEIPAPDLAALDPALRPNARALEVAYHYLCAETDDPRTHTDLRKAYAALQRGYTLTSDATIELVGSDGHTIYIVGHGICVIKGQFEATKNGRHRPALCRGWKAAQRRSGACYHCWATDMLRVAQALERGDL